MTADTTVVSARRHVPSVQLYLTNADSDCHLPKPPLPPIP